MKIVCDTNVLISGLLWCGPWNEILKRVRDRQLILLITPRLLEELTEVLSRPKFERRREQLQVTPDELVNRVISLSVIVEDEDLVSPVILADPDDDVILACAVRARASVIVSGDGHLLSLGIYQGVPIRPPAQFVDEMKVSCG